MENDSNSSSMPQRLDLDNFIYRVDNRCDAIRLIKMFDILRNENSHNRIDVIFL